MANVINFQDNPDEYVSPVVEYFEGEWDKLTPEDKAMCLNYKRQIDLGMEMNPYMLMVINDIHERYPDFHMGHIPKNLSGDKHFREVSESLVDHAVTVLNEARDLVKFIDSTRVRA